MTNILRLLQICWISPSLLLVRLIFFHLLTSIYFPCLLSNSLCFSILLSSLFLSHSSCLLVPSTDFHSLFILLLFPSSLIFSTFSYPFLFYLLLPFSSHRKLHQKPVMLNANLLQTYINQTLPLISKREKEPPPSFPQSERTAFSTVVPTEVNYGWPSILHTLKWSAGAGHKTLSICYIHQSSL